MNLSPYESSILLIGHGSRDPVAVREFLDFAKEFEHHNEFNSPSQQFKVTCSFLELSDPPISQTLEQLAVKGITEIVVVPYLLFRAGHVKTEIPEIIKEFQQSHPKIKITYGNALWPHINLIELAKERITVALKMFPESIRNDVDVLVVGRGASDSEATDQFIEAIQELRRSVSCRELRHCFIALAEPRYSQVLPEMLQNGTRHLLIFPFYLFTGILVKRIETQAKQAQEAFNGTTIKIVPYFGSHPLMFQMLRDKIEEARMLGIGSHIDQDQD